VRKDGPLASTGAIRRNLVASPAWGVVAVSIGTLTVGVLSTRVGGVSHLLYAFGVPAGVLFGPIGAVGFAFGTLCLDLLAGVPLSIAVVRATGAALFVVVGYATWDWRPRPTFDHRRLSALVTYTTAVTIASLCSVAFLATCFELLGRAAFVTSVPALASDHAVPALFVGPVVLYAGAYAVGVDPGQDRDGEPRPTTATILGVALIAFAWLVAWSALSLIHHDLATFSGTRRNVAALLPDILEPAFFTAFVEFYLPLQGVGAIMAVLGIATLFVRDEYSVRTRRVRQRPAIGED